MVLKTLQRCAGWFGYSLFTYYIWVKSSIKVSSNMHKMQRLRFIPRSARPPPVICSPLIHSELSKDSVSGHKDPDQTARMRRLIWAFAAAYARRHVFARRDPLCHMRTTKAQISMCSLIRVFSVLRYSLL